MARRLVLALSLCLLAHDSEARSAADSGVTRMNLNDQYIAKAGIGVIYGDLYIVLRSSSNELLLPQGKTWKGKAAGSPEVVIVFEGRAWPADRLPRNFELSKAVIVSFEAYRVTFADLIRMQGGHYLRVQEG